MLYGQRDMLLDYVRGVQVHAEDLREVLQRWYKDVTNVLQMFYKCVLLDHVGSIKVHARDVTDLTGMLQDVTGMLQDVTSRHYDRNTQNKP
jgi:hypothetical protein